jgi:hypothetical protein
MIIQLTPADEYACARALTRIAPYLPDESKSTALAIVHQINDPGARVRALCGLANSLPQEAKDAALPEALTIAHGISNAWLRVRALIGVSMSLPLNRAEDVRREAFATALTIQNEWQRGRALRLLADLLPEDLIDRAIAMTQTIQDVQVRVLTLSSYAGHLPEKVVELLKAAPTMIDEWLRASMLSSLAKYLPADSIDQAAAIARQINDPAPRVEALSRLARQYSAKAKIDLLGEAYISATSIEDDSARAETLIALIEHLPDEMKAAATRAALAAARAAVDPEMRALLLTDLLGDVEENPGVLEKPGFFALLYEALNAARQIGQATSRAEALSALLGHLSPDQRQIIVPEVLGLMV